MVSLHCDCTAIYPQLAATLAPIKIKLAIDLEVCINIQILYTSD